MTLIFISLYVRNVLSACLAVYPVFLYADLLFLNVSEPAGQDLHAVPATLRAALPEPEAAVGPAADVKSWTWSECEFTGLVTL